MLLNGILEYKSTIQAARDEQQDSDRVGAIGNNIFMNLTSNSTPRLRTTRGRRRSEYKYTLAHEIGHVYARYHNLEDRRVWVRTPNGREILRNENFAMHFENMYIEYDRTQYNNMRTAEIYPLIERSITELVELQSFDIIPSTFNIVPDLNFNISIREPRENQPSDQNNNSFPDESYDNPLDHGY